jgi:phosphotransferase system  glucose/maltose/N-acetylglucosamine-specific IIC component
MYDSNVSTQDPVASTRDASVAQLVTGIVGDAQELMRQQITLFKHELRKDLKEAKQVSISFAVSCLLGGISVLLLSFMLAYLVNWLWPAMPVWVGFGIIGALYAVICISLFFFAKEKLQDMAPMSDEALNATKENLQWTRKPN